jgi:hypothetical protein
MQLAFDAQYNCHPVAPFLRSEVHRAIVLEDPHDDMVQLNTWVTYRLDKRPAEKRLLVPPHDYVPDEQQLSVLSSLGAALIGIRAGDAMPFLCTEGNLHLVTPLAIGHESAGAGLMTEHPVLKPRSRRHVSLRNRSPLGTGGLIDEAAALGLPACCKGWNEQPKPAFADLEFSDAPDA